ncbi:5-methylthioadenosine/S-adenosylhomocysteine deaminase [Marininema mesophilum]|uniref:5-methylthioadenosine/S-adenosylhomocysteine deaminase n=1 Tax=Marininema mesophilum TaxID=1048340 RepID=A0A1H2ZNG2_9BACL|nr:amidohydrolase [Marininema mesophilum]SDX18861.1 5-methylthioadenosine/S-adenosylhomocysteine deaminase [Marininema mesophilum]
MKRLFTHTRILTMTEEVAPSKTQAMLVENDKIAWIGPEEEAPMADEIVDLRGRLMMPGWINTHGHATMTLLRSFADDIPLKTWLEKYMWPIEARFGAEQVHWGTMLAATEMVRCGTTCFADMYDHMDGVAEVVQESGLRASLCRGVIGLGSQEERDWKRKEAYQFAKDWHGRADGRITTMMSPHAPYTCPPDYIEEIVADAEELKLPIHIHLAETKGEVEGHIETYGMRPVKHLQLLGVFNRPTLIAHAVHVTEEEMEILLQHDVKISHNPGSNLKLGSGIAPVPRMLAKGLRPSLGTDGAASNNNLDIMEEVRLAALIHKGSTMNPEVIPAWTALQMGTSYGAEALFLDHEIGTLEVGKMADFITLDLEKAHLRPAHDLISLLVYSASREDIQDVYINGRPLMRNKELLTIDEERVLFEADRTFQAVAP